MNSKVFTKKDASNHDPKTIDLNEHVFFKKEIKRFLYRKKSTYSVPNYVHPPHYKYLINLYIVKERNFLENSIHESLTPTKIINIFKQILELCIETRLLYWFEKCHISFIHEISLHCLNMIDSFDEDSIALIVWCYGILVLDRKNKFLYN